LRGHLDLAHAALPSDRSPFAPESSIASEKLSSIRALANPRCQERGAEI